MELSPSKRFSCRHGAPCHLATRHSGRAAPTQRCAFTLIEVVIALAIFATAAVVLSQAFTNALLAREHGLSNDKYESDIRTVRLQLLLEPTLEDAENGGEIETYHSGAASWQTRIEPTNVVDLFRVELQIEFSQAEDGQDLDYVETLYLLPDMVGGRRTQRPSRRQKERAREHA